VKTFLIFCCSFFILTSCSQVKVEQKEDFVALRRPQQLFILPFSTVMVPNAVSEGFFDRLVDNLNQGQATTGLEFVILKQDPQVIGTKWLSEHTYVAGEISAYVEDRGSTTVSLRAKTRLIYYAAGAAEPSLKLSYPAEVFYEKDYQTMDAARLQLAEKIADQLAQKLLETLAGS